MGVLVFNLAFSIAAGIFVISGASIISRRRYARRSANRLAAWSAPSSAVRSGVLVDDLERALTVYVRHLATPPPPGAERAHEDASRRLHVDYCLVRNEVAAVLDGSPEN